MTPTPRHTLSACLIVLNERENIARALASVAFCDEIVVVDSGSQDGTQVLARDAGATVVENAWPGFGAQRNVAADHATSDWVLEVDADETITPGLAAEIADFLATPGPRDRVDLLALPMRHHFLGADLGPSAQYPNYRTRMFRRGTYRHDERRAVHEGLKPHEAVLALRGDMTHQLAGSWREAVADVWRYTKLEASTFRPASTPRNAATGVLVRPLAKVVYRLGVDGAWRDGWRGVVKVGLDAGSDSVVWLRALRHGQRGADTHFGEVMPADGPLRLVALATSVEGTARAAAWLDGAIAAGAGTDSELISPVPGPPGAFYTRRTPTGGPLSFARAMLGATQVRRVDAILPADAGARRAHRLLAPPVRGATAPIGVHEPAPAAVARLSAELR